MGIDQIWTVSAGTGVVHLNVRNNYEVRLETCGITVTVLCNY